MSCIARSIETVAIGHPEDHVSLLNVTLGGIGNEGGARHSKARRGVLIGAGSIAVLRWPPIPRSSPCRPGRSSPDKGMPGATMTQVIDEPDYVI